MANADPRLPQLVLKIDATLADIRAALQTITAELRACQAACALVEDSNIVLYEVMTNIARHGYPFKTGWIGCTVTLRADGLACHVTDAGVAFDPTCLNNTPPPPQFLAEGGYGWALIHALSVDMRYDRCEGKNTLHFVIPAQTRNVRSRRM